MAVHGNDIMGLSREEYLSEIGTRSEELRRDAQFLYPRMRVACLLYNHFNPYDTPESPKGFLYEYNVEDTYRFVRTVIDRDAAHQEMMGSARTTVDPEDAPYFEDYHVPYLFTEEEIRDGIDMYYGITRYVSEVRPDIEQFDASGFVGILRYSRDILWRLRVTVFIPEMREKLAATWLQNFPDGTAAEALTNQFQAPPVLSLGLVSQYGDSTQDSSLGNGSSQRRILERRDGVLRRPYLSYVSSIFSASLAGADFASA